MWVSLPCQYMSSLTVVYEQRTLAAEYESMRVWGPTVPLSPRSTLAATGDAISRAAIAATTAPRTVRCARSRLLNFMPDIRLCLLAPLRQDSFKCDRVTDRSARGHDSASRTDASGGQPLL